MSAILLTAPAVEPVSLDEARAFLRVENNDDDEAIAALTSGARIHVEAGTRRALITQNWRLSFDAWPDDGRLECRIIARAGIDQILDTIPDPAFAGAEEFLMAASSYDESLRRLLVHEGGYTNDAADPGGPTNFGITIFDYRKYVKPDATAADVRAMKVEEAKSIYRAKYWDAQRCDELPAGVDYAVFDYGVNSGIGRSKKVLQRVIGVPADGVLGDGTMKAVAAGDAKQMIAAICDERLRFLQSLRTWPVFGKGWGRRVSEVKTVALAMAASAPMPDIAAQSAQGRAFVSVRKGAQQGTAGAAIAAGAAAAQQAHQSGHSTGSVIAIVVAAAAVAIAVWAFWHWRQKQQQEKVA